jgi:hypothetical protein
MPIQVSKLTSVKLLRTFQRRFRDGKTMTDKIKDLRKLDNEAKRLKKLLRRR